MVWDEYRSIQAQRGAIAFSKPAAAAAWQSLPLSGLAAFADQHVEARGRDLSYAGTATPQHGAGVTLGRVFLPARSLDTVS